VWCVCGWVGVGVGVGVGVSALVVRNLDVLNCM
jgi:hypothetical protein